MMPEKHSSVKPLPFDKKTSASDGVFRAGLGTGTHLHIPSSSYSSLLTSGMMEVDHYLKTPAGVIINYETSASVEYGRNEKLGEKIKARAFIQTVRYYILSS